MNRTVKIVLGIVGLLVVIVAGVYIAGNFIIPNSIRSSYQGKDCERVLSLEAFYASLYPASIADKSVPDMSKECALYSLAADAENQKSWQDAYNVYKTYKQTYPKGLFISEAEQRSGAVLVNLAKDQLAAKKHADAISTIQAVLKNHAQTTAAADANDLMSDVYLDWAKGQREASDFGGAEATLKAFSAWATEAKQTETVKSAQRELALTYLAWGKAFQAQQKFEDARAKFEQVISTDPEPLAKTGPASQAKTAKLQLYVEWGDLLLGKADFGGALDRYQSAISLSEEKDQPAAKDRIAGVYVKWAETLSKTEDFLGALGKLDEATKNSGTDTSKKTVESAKTGTYQAFSNSSGAQATAAMKSAIKDVCEKNKKPQLPIFGIDKKHVLAAMYGVEDKLPDNVTAKTPGSLHYVACVEMTTATLELRRILWADFAREQYTWNVTLRPINDPTTVTKTSIVGGVPPALPKITYANIFDYLLGGYFYRQRGSNPDPVTLANWLLTVLK